MLRKPKQSLTSEKVCINTKDIERKIRVAERFKESRIYVGQ